MAEQFIIKVSIIMITKNRANFLPAAINSVLEQTFTDWELIIVDDNSTDNTKVLIDEYIAKDVRIKYSLSEKSGIAPNRNIALGMAQGEYVAVLDSDDVWSDVDKLRKQVNFLDNNPDYCLIGGSADFIDLSGNVIGGQIMPTDDYLIKKSLTAEDNFIHSSVLYRLSVVLNVGGYDETLFIGEDWDLWLKLGLRAKLANLPEKLIGYRLHDGNSGHNKEKAVLMIGYNITKKYRRAYPNYLLNNLKWFYRLIKFSFKTDKI